MGINISTYCTNHCGVQFVFMRARVELEKKSNKKIEEKGDQLL
jgi:heme/copper-type cytochrome/quinol oxidase subunit 2